MKKYICIKPVNLELEKRIEQFPPNFNYNLDYFYYLINIILRITAYNFKRNQKRPWISMCSTVLKRHPYDYREHIRYLGDNFPNEGNILLRDDYSKGKCYSYQLSSFYKSSAVDIVEITDSKLLKFLAPKQVVESNNKFKKNYNFLAKYFDSSKLKIDYISAVEQNIETYYKELDYKKHLLNAIQVMGIANGEFKLVYCPDTDGRVHTQITRLSKKLRKFLTYEGKELAEIDISASVPTFLYFILLNQYNSSSNSHLSSIVNSSKSYCNHYMFCKSSESLDIAEISSFVDIPVMLTPHSGHTDPPKDFGQKDNLMTILQFFS